MSNEFSRKRMVVDPYRKETSWNKSQKEVIPAAGIGNCFLPATKALAKEMLPIVDKPTIQFIVEEAPSLESKTSYTVTGKSKRSIEDHFDSNLIEYNLKEKRENRSLKLVDETNWACACILSVKHIHVVSRCCLASQGFRWKMNLCRYVCDDLMDTTDEKGWGSTYQTTHGWLRAYSTPLLSLSHASPSWRSICLWGCCLARKEKTAFTALKPSAENQRQRMLLATCYHRTHHTWNLPNSKPSSRQEMKFSWQMQSIPPQ